MIDYQYPDGLEELRNPALQRLIDEVHREIGVELQLWIRVEDFARKISVGLLNARSTAVTLVVAKCGRLCPEVDGRVLDKVRGHLRSAAEDDLTIELV